MAAYTTIDNPELYFQCKIYTGNGSATHAITFDGDEDMQPDLVWIKNRSSAENHALVDSVRGVGKQLLANATAGEYSNANSVKAFNSNGFSVGDLSDTNGNTNNLVAWCWKESATSGFDIVSYTGNGSNRTISHSLSATPDLVITKRRDNTGNWMVGGSTTLGGDNKLLLMDTTAALDDNSEVYQSFSSSTFGIGVNAYINTNTSTYISYLFANKQGAVKCGSYTGNGNADGTFVYTGFRPAMVITKKTSGVKNWYIWDNKREPNNDGSDAQLYPNLSNAEDSAAYVDFLSNGFKLRNSGAANDSGGTNIFMAFAEAPFVNSNGVPCNAR